MDFIDEYESQQNQRKLALSTVDEMMITKLQLLDAGKDIPKFINNTISFLKKRYMTEEQTLSYKLLKKNQPK